ncbi:MAG: GntR family transcriptional regulator [Erysipelotrichaceae bacterium]|nr:GntR family transcriptional regulator [Erysipelotrichaceae bacterium]
MTQAKYKIIEEHIMKMIDSGELKAGDQIMTEEQLSRMFSFSRMTINKALNRLQDSGYIKRTPGRGSFVSAPVVRKPSISITSFTEDMKLIGLHAGSKLISYEVIKAAAVPEIRDKLHLTDNDMVHHFVRLRTGNNIPIAVTYNYVSVRIVPAIDISSLDSSFYGYLDSIGIRRVAKDMELSATLPNAQQKELLQIDNAALLCSAHVTYTIFNNKQVPFEYSKTFYNGDSYSYIFS